MSTRSDIGYELNGETIFTYCHYDGFPNSIVPQLMEALLDHGFDWFVGEIEIVSEKGGIRSLEYDGHNLSPDVFTDGEKTMYPDTENDFGYVVKPDLTIDIYKYGEVYDKINHHRYVQIIFKDDKEIDFV